MTSRNKAFSLLAAIALTGIIAGCGTISGLFTSPTASDTVGKTEGVVIPTVNGAMLAWKDWVVAGHATQAQVDAVKAGYQQYYNAQLAASNAVTTYLAVPATNTAALAVAQSNVIKATQAAGNTQTNLINLITTFKK